MSTKACHLYRHSVDQQNPGNLIVNMDRRFMIVDADEFEMYFANKLICHVMIVMIFPIY